MIEYIKKDQTVRVSPKFIYCSSVYRIWKKGASLIEETHYASNSPLDSKKIETVVKKNGYIIQRFLELEGAPEEYLINQGFKVKKL